MNINTSNSEQKKQNSVQKALSIIERVILKTTSLTEIGSEIDIYFKEPRIQFVKHFDILCWWNERKTNFPILHKLANNYLSIQPTSVPSERSFSLSGLIITKLRNRLHPETARWLMCLKSWNEFLELYKKRDLIKI